MVWSNWRTAISRGALLVLLCWTGIAWTQGPSQPAASDAAERIMVVHENGKSTRCRVVESWRLPDGRLAHLLQSMETGDYLTIVDDQAPNADQSVLLQKNPRAMPKRIFPWGRMVKTPPEGSPIPPHLRIDSGLVLKNESLPPNGASITPGSNLVNREIDERRLGKRFGVHSEGIQPLDFQSGLAKASPPTNEPPTPKPTPVAQSSGFEMVGPFAAKSTPADVQVLTLPAAPSEGGNKSPSEPGKETSPGPLIVNQGASVPGAALPTATGTRPNTTSAALPSIPVVQNMIDFPAPKVAEPTTPVASLPLAPKVAEPATPITSLPAAPQVGEPSIPLNSLPTAPKVVDGNAPALSLPKPTPATPTVANPPAMTKETKLAMNAKVQGEGNNAVPIPTLPTITTAPTTPGANSASTPSQPPSSLSNPFVPTPYSQSKSPAVDTRPAFPYLKNPFGAKTTVAQNTPVATTPSATAPSSTSSSGAVPTQPTPVVVPDKGIDPTTKKPWRLGDKFQSMFQGKPASPSDKKDAAKPLAQKTNPGAETILPAPTRSEQKISSNERPFRPAFSTAMVNQPSLTPPVQPPPTSVPLVIASPATAPSPTTPNKTVTIVDKTVIPPPPDKIILIREGVKDSATSVVPTPVSIPPAPVVTADKTNPPATPAPQRSMWGTAQANKVVPPGKSVLDAAAPAPEVAQQLPTLPARKSDPLLAPERWNPGEERLKAKVTPPPEVQKTAAVRPAPPTLEAPRSAPVEGNWPPGTQSVLAAKSSSPGAIIYVPVPTMTVPQPNLPPSPPEPKLDAPQLNAYVNAFSAPPAPKGQTPNGGMVQPASYNPMMNPQGMMTQDPMQAQQMYYQQMMAAMYQQQMMQQQAMNPYSNRPNPAMMNPYMPPNAMMNPMMAQNNAMPAQGQAMNFARSYTGPQPPNPFGTNAPMQGGMMPAGYPQMQTMMPMQQGMVQPASYQQPQVAPQYSVAAQLEQAMRVLRESPYPAQREWAAQSFVSFDWRSNPAIVPVLLQSALQDPAPSVRAGCVYTLGRMQAAVEPVYTTLQRLRSDTDPRVRLEVEQAFIRLGQPATGARPY